MDLYCGSGNFSLPLMAAGLRGVGVESSQHSVSAATQAAREQELQGRFVTDDAGRYVSRAFGESRSVELIILDPPRSGVKQALAAMAQVASRHICMVSCDPVTFARDLRALSDAGFSVELLEAYDMFPQTHHVESLAWLTRVP
jgi:23S rRNA (uracil1939-C5)-methyltransferase